MAGRKYKCEACGIELWRPYKTLCPACGGPMSSTAKKERKTEICAICERPFMPRWCTEKTCSPECSHKLKLRKAAEAAKRRYHAAIAKGKKPPVQRYGTPWLWLSRAIDDEGGASMPRNILHVLEDQTAAGDWPYYDVLAGVGTWSLL